MYFFSPKQFDRFFHLFPPVWEFLPIDCRSACRGPFTFGQNLKDLFSYILLGGGLCIWAGEGGQTGIHVRTTEQPNIIQSVGRPVSHFQKGWTPAVWVDTGIGPLPPFRSPPIWGGEGTEGVGLSADDPAPPMRRTSARGGFWSEEFCLLGK